MSRSVSTSLTAPSLPIDDLPGFLDETESLVENIIGPWNQILFEEE